MTAYLLGTRILLRHCTTKMLAESSVRSRLSRVVSLSHCYQQSRGAGHSHWQNIRHIKGANDALKQKVNADITRKIKLAVLDGGGSTNPKLNSNLARVLDEGKAKDVPSATMLEALKRIERGKSTKGSQVFVEARAIGNSCVIVEGQTDKPKWFRQQVQHVLKQYGGRIGDSGVAAPNFHFKGVVYSFVDGDANMDRALEAAIEAGAEDVQLNEEDNSYQFICDSKQVHAVKTSLTTLGFKVHDARQEFLPHTYVKLDLDTLSLASEMLDKLEVVEDVARVYSNVDSATSTES